uniref:Uncharacterized protein n=1 Tax=Solanum lycopersicum TaxID=4081 RepID=A0A3Q7JUC9_SOLLC
MKIGQIKHRWNPGEDELLKKLIEEHGAKNWSFISQLIPSRTMSEDLTFEKPQLPLQRSSSVGTCINLGSPSKSHLSNLEFSRFPQLCLYPPTIPLCQNLPHSTYSPVIPYPFTSLTFYESYLSNLCISRYPWLSLYPYIAQLSEIFPFSSGSLVLPSPSTTLILSLSGFKPIKNLNPINRIDQEDEVTLV